MVRRLIPSRGYVGLLVVAVALAALFVRLGFWQLHRLHERQVFKASVLRAERSAPRPLSGIAGSRRDPDPLAFRRVAASGTYATADEVVLYGRALNGRPGNQVLTPLVTASGRALLVDRGWVPPGLDHPPVRSAAPPAGRVTVTGLLFPAEDASAGSGKVEAVTRIDIQRIRAGLPYPLFPVYLQLQGQVPPQAHALPVRLPPPDLDAGPPNLSYAIQWFSFAAIALVGYLVLALRRSPEGSSGDSAKEAFFPTTIER
jgi:cytochrome oxidase assembly protein ShyY1